MLLLKPRSASGLVCLLLCAALLPGALRAQSSQQVATTIGLNYPLSPRAIAKLDVGGSAQVYGTGQWDRIGLQPAVDVHLARWADLLTQVQLDYVYQAANVNTFEFRPAVGVRLFWVPTSRVILRNRTLLEFRDVVYLAGDTSSTSWRLRDRIETRIAINHPTFEWNRLLYFIGEFEGLLNPEGAPDERFLDKFILTLGLGFRFDYTWRIEAGWQGQEAVNSARPGDPKSVVNALQLRLIHYIR
jgi:hypothetical protein